MLAFVILRLSDPNDEQGHMQKLVMQSFVERGNKANDPYVRAIGWWWLKDHVRAVNELTPVQPNASEHLF